MRTLIYIFSVRNAIKRKKDLFSLKRSATCAMAKNNLLKRFATSVRGEVAQLALCASNCGMPTSGNRKFKVLFRCRQCKFSMYESVAKLPCGEVTAAKLLATVLIWLPFQPTALIADITKSH